MRQYILLLSILFITLFSCKNAGLSPDEITKADSIYQYGKRMESEGKADSAVIFYRKSLSIVENSNQYELIGTIYNQLAELLWLHNYYDRAISCYQDAFDATKKLEDMTLSSKSLRGIGKCYILKNQFDSALIQMEKAYELHPQIKNKKELASLYNNLSVVCSELGYQDRAMEWNVKSMSITEDTLLNFRNYALRSDLCYKEGKYDSAVHYAHLGLRSQDIYIRSSCTETLYLVANQMNSPDTTTYLRMVTTLSDSIKNSNKAAEIGDAELKLKQEQIIKAMNQQPRNWVYWVLGCIITINMIIFTIYIVKRKKQPMNTAVIGKPLQSDITSDREQVIIKKGELYSELFQNSLSYQTTLEKLSKKKNLTYNEQKSLMESIGNTFEPYIEELDKHLNLTHEESLLCCLSLLKLSNQQCAACKNVSENAIRTQKSRIKNKITQIAAYDKLFDAIFNRK